jgi:hypothetical protein
MTAKEPPFELNEEMLRKLQLERIHEVEAETEAMRELLTLIPMASDVVTHMRKAGATPRQIGLVLRFATALTRAESQEDFQREICLFLEEPR